jgi:hypothetical protein
MEPSSMGRRAVLNTCTLLLVMGLTATLKVPVMESKWRSKYIKKGGTTQRPTDILHTLFHTGSAYSTSDGAEAQGCRMGQYHASHFEAPVVP